MHSEGWLLESSSSEKGLGVLVDTRLTLSSNMTLWQRRLMILELWQEGSCWNPQGGDPAPLRGTGETIAGVLGPLLGSPEQE